LGAGYDVAGLDPDPERCAAFSERGGRPVSAVDVWNASVILAAVFDTDQLASIIDDAPKNTGATLISTSTCDPERMPDLAQTAATKDIVLIEAPLSGTSKDLADGNAVFLLAGDADKVAELGDLWKVLGRSSHFVGGIGNGNRAKLAINLVLGLNRAALAEGLVFAERIGLDPASFLPLLQDSAANSSVMASKGPKMAARDFAPLGRIAQSAKDFGLIYGSAKAKGQHLPFARTYLDMMELCLDAGDGDLDNAAILLAIEKAKTPT
jgi:3-hydroxyisobutyrate dehydrogenase-like beta-hydroxyacid dehydrogenase